MLLSALFFEKDLLLNMELADLFKQAGQQALGILPVSTSIGPELQAFPTNSSFHVGTGDLMHILMLAMVGFTNLTTSLTPPPFFF